MRLKLFYKLFAAFLFVALLPSLVGSYIFTGKLEKYLHTRIHIDGIVRLDRTAILITDVINHIDDVLAKLAKHIRFTDTDREMINWLYSTHPQINKIVVVDMNGTIREAVSRYSYMPQGKVLEDCKPTSVNEKRIRFSRWNNEPMLTVDYPIFSLSSGEQRGVLHAEITISSLFSSLSVDMDKHIQYIVNGYNGHVIFHPDFNFVLNHQDASQLPVVRQVLDGVDFSHLEYIDFNGDGVLGLARNIAGIPLVLVEETPFDVAYSLIQQRNKVRYTILWASIVFILITAYIFSRSITRPMAKLIEVTEEIGQGNLDAEVPRVKARWPDEISVFSDHFQQMVKALKGDRQKRDEAVQKEQEAHEKLRKSQKMEAIGLMAGGVAHDLNNLLSGVVGYPELILKDLPEDSKLRGQIEAIRESGQRASTVVADLLTVARGAASTREVHNLNSLIEEYLHSPEYYKLQSLYPHIVLQQHLKATQANILCSSVHIKKCLMNLVINAAEAITAGDGTVLISSHNYSIDDADSLEHGIKTGDYIILSVEDTGPGISNGDMEHIFDPFYTKKVMGRSGTGLGLTVVWNTMEDHGGKILVESSHNGTCFHLYFPVCTDEKTVPDDGDEGKVKNGNSEYILVVDDEPQLRDIACQMLQGLNYRVDSVCSGELAVEFIKENPPVDLVVIDMLMEPGMNGRQTYEEICKLCPGQKAIVVSGFSESDDVKDMLRKGAGMFVKKPYSMGELSRAVNMVLSSAT